MEQLSKDEELERGIYDNKIEIIPISRKEEENYFININKGNESYYHIYFNDKKKK